MRRVRLTSIAVWGNVGLVCPDILIALESWEFVFVLRLRAGGDPSTYREQRLSPLLLELALKCLVVCGAESRLVTRTANLSVSLYFILG